MSGKQTPDSLDVRVERALGAWPLPDKGDAEWEGMATAIERRIAAVGGSRASTGTLLDPPLPVSPGEGPRAASEELVPMNEDRPVRIPSPQEEGKMRQPSMERERDRRSLRDLAKLASAPSLTPTPPPSVAPPGSSMPPSIKMGPSSSSIPAAPLSSPPPGSESSGGDSGIVDLKTMATADPGAAERAKDTKLASTELFDDEPEQPRASSAPRSSTPAAGASARASTAPASTSKADVAMPATAASSVRPAAIAAHPAPTKTDEAKKGGMVWLGVVGVLAVAAAAVFMLRGESTAPTAATPASPAESKPVPAAPAKPRPAETVAAADTPPSSPPVEEKGVDPNSLPSASATGPKAKNDSARVVAAPPPKSVTVAGKSEPDPLLVAKNIPKNPSQGGSLEAEMQKAVPKDDSAEGTTKPASGPQVDHGNVPQRPSSGAIAGGIGSVMGQARACLGLDDPISHATITFDSSGSVSSVKVSGFAAGKPAEACIKAALGQAKVPPFAEPSYTQSITVRPNS